MANPLATPEAVAHAVVDKKAAIGVVPGSPQEGAVRLRKTSAAEGPRSALESMKKVPDASLGEQRIEDNIGTRLPDGTKSLSTDEITRLGDAKTARKLIQLVMEKGYAGVIDAGDRGTLRKSVEVAIDKWPEGDR